MKNHTFGFSIVEMTISIMISAMLMTAALTIYNQISKSFVKTTSTTQLDTTVMILHNRLNTDLQGLMPLWFADEQKSEKVSQESTTQNNQPVKKSSSSDHKKYNNFLYAQSKNDQFNLLTFVTTNALASYAEKPIRTARVTYVLQPDEKNSSHFKLMRKQEEKISSNFDIEKLNTGNFVQIAQKITSCKVEYGFIDQSPEQRAQDPSKPLNFKFVSQWGSNKEEIEQKNEYNPILPDVLKLTIQIEHFPDQPSKTYELTCNIPTSHAKAIQSFSEKKKSAAPKAGTPVWRNQQTNKTPSSGLQG